MKIARYIGDLLYDYECVVIPGLGGFLTNDKPASIQPNTHHFRPPYKQIMFNAYLKTNDGLLVNYIAREENIAYKEAKAQVDKFVYLCDQALKSGKRINFHKVGSLYLNKKGIIVFEQDHSVNYNADAFGLTSFVSPAVRRTSPEEKLREAVAPSTEKKNGQKAGKKATPEHPSVLPKHEKLLATKKKSPYRTQLAFLTGLIIAMFIGWGFMNKDMVSAYYNNYSSVIPLFYSQSNAYLINNIDRVPMEKVSNSRFGSWWLSLFEKKAMYKREPTTKPETSQPKKETGTMKKGMAPAVKKKARAMAVSTPAVKATPIATKTAFKKPVTQPVKAVSQMHRYHYYIIAGAFKSPGNVRSLIYALRKKGYDALAVGMTSSGLHRVAFGAFTTRQEAEKKLNVIRRNENPSAWILVH